MWLDNLGSIPSKGKNFCIHHHVQIVYGAYEYRRHVGEGKAALAKCNTHLHVVQG